MTVTRTLVRTTYLELDAASAPRPPGRAKPNYELRRAAAASPEFARFLYAAVGYRWNWSRRLGWTWAEWHDYLRRDGRETWVAYVGGTPAGYFEMAAGAADGVEITQFGLLPSFIGIGLGGYLLCDAVQRARELRPGRVWLHTCTEDHPHALSNYRARGFRPFKEEAEYEDVRVDLEPWPGAQAPH